MSKILAAVVTPMEGCSSHNYTEVGEALGVKMTALVVWCGWLRAVFGCVTPWVHVCAGSHVSGDVDHAHR